MNPSDIVATADAAFDDITDRIRRVFMPQAQESIDRMIPGAGDLVTWDPNHRCPSIDLGDDRYLHYTSFTEGGVGWTLVVRHVVDDVAWRVNISGEITNTYDLGRGLRLAECRVNTERQCTPDKSFAWDEHFAGWWGVRAGDLERMEAAIDKRARRADKREVAMTGSNS